MFYISLKFDCLEEDWLNEGGGPEGVYLIVDSTTISNLFYNLQSDPKSTIYGQNLAKIYNFRSKATNAVDKG